MGDVLGTPNYMSPEQVMGQKVDSRSDLFSVGVVLYKLLTNALPFEGDSVISVAYKIAKSEAPPVNSLRPEIPLTLRRIVERALKKQPEKRFQTGEEMALALIDVARELNEEESKKGTGRIPLGIRWALMMVALVAVTMTVTATILYQRQYQAMTDQVQDFGGSLAKFIATQRRAAARRGLDRARRVHPGDAGPAGLRFHHDRRPHGRCPGQQPGGTGQPEARPADRQGPVERQGGRRGRQPSAGRRARRARLRRPGPVPGQADRPGAPGNLSGAVVQGRQLHAGDARDPDAGDDRRGGRRHIPAGARTFRADARPAHSLDELANGRYDYRINDPRKDELGELYAEFVRTAAALEARHDPPNQGDCAAR